MYDLHDYARMIADEARMGPYVRALEEVVRTGSVVVDLGTGTGIMALVACRLGAKRVYAIETSDAIDVGRELARENGFADRIIFLRGDARKIELPERADVIVSDLRGVLPLYKDHLDIVADARERFLKPGGVLVPARDRLMVAIVENPALYALAIGPGRGPLGVTLDSMQGLLRNAPFTVAGASPAIEGSLASDAVVWATLEYASALPESVEGSVELRVERSSTGHGLLIWFETTLACTHGFSTASRRHSCYGQLFLPWPQPVALLNGDIVAVNLWSQASGDPWGWNSSMTSGNGTRKIFKQSSFLAFTGALRPASEADPRVSPLAKFGGLR